MKVRCRFCYATITLVLFGVLCQILCDYLRYDTQSLQHIIGLVISVVVGLVSDIVIICIHVPRLLCRIFQICAIILISSLTILLMWSFSYQYNGKNTVIGNGAAISIIDSVAEKDRLIEATKFFGQGRDIYRYDKEVLPSAENMEEMLEEPYLSLSLEKAGAYSVFGDYRNSSMLYVLNHTYGFWITLICTGICTSWFAFGLYQCLRIQKLGNKLVFLSCLLFFASFMIGTLLDTVGIHLWTYAIPIISFNLYDTMLEFGLLGIMFAAVKLDAMDRNKNLS